MWHRVAPRLAEKYTVVATDLRGWAVAANRRAPPSTSRTACAPSPATRSR
ncbi:hypothetical protein O7616_15370 [Micromonospora sp. WMMD964]|nr:hypothetical protein [Micromonospora sp. WMMD964]WFF04290.1 hypothetical protein O7616_15370 [Micromonospora sp. WMMD964]